LLRQDNARPHITAVALAALTDIGGTAQHLPYSLDLVPCDFWAFPTLKRQLRGKRVSSDDELIKRHGCSAKRDVAEQSILCV
jgi:hypothetical protein